MLRCQRGKTLEYINSDQLCSAVCTISKIRGPSHLDRTFVHPGGATDNGAGASLSNNVLSRQLQLLAVPQAVAPNTQRTTKTENIVCCRSNQQHVALDVITGVCIERKQPPKRTGDRHSICQNPKVCKAQTTAKLTL